MRPGLIMSLSMMVPKIVPFAFAENTVITLSIYRLTLVLQVRFRQVCATLISMVMTMLFSLMRMVSILQLT